ncbi:hypothetical protein DFH06DRAFT_1294984 [Mycena polygramma]|nr:hypothetical protein DFH06DRAFT_1294984 [Mycena polygramma]
MVRTATSPKPPAKQSARTKAKTNENRTPAKRGSKPATRAAGEIDPFGAEMEKKFNIEGSRVQENVFLQQNMDRAQVQIKEQAAALAALQAELAAAKASKAPPSTFAADVTNQVSAAATAGPSDEGNVADELAKAIAKNAHLEKQLALAKTQAKSKTSEGVDGASEKIPRPSGTAGNDFNIQDAMGLGGNTTDREKYKMLLRNLRDLLLQAGIPWELPWAKVPVGLKDKFFRVAAKKHPILERYENDWATEEIAKQAIKNKRRTSYKNGSLEVPAEYAYLKANSAKRDPSAPRGRKHANVDKAKKVAKKRSEVARKRPSKKAQSSTSAQSKGKGRMMLDDEDSMSDGGGAGAGEDDEDSSASET